MEHDRLNPIDLESARLKLLEDLSVAPSNYNKLWHYKDYFRLILSYKNYLLEQAFLPEFINEYLECIAGYEVWGNDIKVSEKLLSQLKLQYERSSLPEYNSLLKTEITRVEEQLYLLRTILDGTAAVLQDNNKTFFPLIEYNSPAGFYGIIESITVKTNKAEGQDRFIIIPSEKVIEKKIIHQCKESWQLAVSVIKKYVRTTNPHHEVIINFDKRIGFYEGNSLGIALTLTFIESLLGYYNPAYSISIRGRTAYTGGISNTGDILAVGEEAVRQKTAAVFFSGAETFVISKKEEKFADEVLAELMSRFPDRNLKLAGVEKLDDVLNRRDLIDIKKINPAVRIRKFFRNNWISAAATLVLSVLFAYTFVTDWDDNPATFTFDKKTLFIKNKNDKVLWTMDFDYYTDKADANVLIKRRVLITDTDEDGVNEVLTNSLKNRMTDNSGVHCYDNRGRLRWSYTFADNVKSRREILDNEYGTILIDTLTYGSGKSLIVAASNLDSFSSAIFRVDLKTGKRAPGTIWASGHVMDCIVMDADSNNIPELYGVGYDNGYEDFVFFAFDIDTLIKVRPSTDEYQILNYPLADMKSYIRFPKTDFDIYSGIRIPAYSIGSFEYRKKIKEFNIATTTLKIEPHVTLGYGVSSNYEQIDVVVGSTFRVQRDSLVAKGLLEQPFTDTEEYKEIVKQNILVYADNRWVKYSHLKRDR